MTGPWDRPTHRPFEPDGNDPFAPLRPSPGAAQPDRRQPDPFSPPLPPTRPAPIPPWPDGSSGPLGGQDLFVAGAPAAPRARGVSAHLRRGRSLGVLVLALAVIVAMILGGSTFAALASVNLGSINPFGAAMAWASVAGVAALAALVVLLMGVAAVIWCRPRVVAGVATGAAAVLPVVAVALALWFGVGLATQNATDDVVNHGSTVALLVLRVAESLGIGLGPLRDVLVGLASSST